MEIKHLMGYIKCILHGIKVNYKSHTYIGIGTNIKGGSNIILGSNVIIRPHVDLWCQSGQIELKEGCEIGERARISIINSLVIGKKVLISPNVYITDCDHEYRRVGIPIMDQGVVKKNNKIIIKDNVFVGINAVIVGNITIGEGSVIGANSVVTKDVPDYSVVAGIPAKIIKKYNREKNSWECVKKI